MTTRQMTTNTDYCESRKVYRRWRVNSDSGRKYVVVQLYNGTYQCSCPGWTRHTPRKPCKHIRHIDVNCGR